MRRLTIGRLAVEAGVGVETIRYYERRGLLTRPPWPGGGGYREYSSRDLAIMQHIKLGKDLGLRLAEIRQLVDLLGTDQRFCEAFQELLSKKLSSVRLEQQRLRRVETEIDRTLSACSTRSSHDGCPIQERLAARDLVKA